MMSKNKNSNSSNSIMNKKHKIKNHKSNIKKRKNKKWLSILRSLTMNSSIKRFIMKSTMKIINNNSKRHKARQRLKGRNTRKSLLRVKVKRSQKALLGLLLARKTSSHRINKSKPVRIFNLILEIV